MRNGYTVTKILEGSDIPRLYNLNEVSQILDIPLGTLYNMHYKKVLPCFKIGKRLKFTEEHIKQIINKGEKLYEC